MPALNNLRHSVPLELVCKSILLAHLASLLASKITKQGVYKSRGTSAAISGTFIALAEASGGKREEPKAVFGNLFSKLQQDYRNDPAFEPFRRLLRACILNAWPVAAGETVLGEVQTERRLHSLYSAARDLGVGVELLEPFLIEAGALTPHDNRISNRRVFSAADHAELLAEVPTLVSIRTLKREIGASRTELDRLIAEDILVPRVKDKNVRLRWSLVKALLHKSREGFIL